jgi:phosphoglycerate dehydrogenase-like enzyme
MVVPKIVYFGPISESRISSLFKDYSQPLELVSGGILGNITPDEVREAIKDATVILTNPGTPHLTKDILEAAEKVRLIQSMIVGYDRIDIQGATELGIPVANNPGWNSISVAELTLMLILMTLRKTLYLIRKGEKGWRISDLVSNFGDLREFKDKTLGIVGLGDIGREVVKRARCFGPKIIYHKRSRLSVKEEKRLGVEYRPFKELLAESDIVSLHIPLNDETRSMIGEDEIASMKDGAIIINTARGEIIDEHAVAKALNTGKLSGAGLDFVNIRMENGVRVPNSPLLECENVIITPHIAGPTRESQIRGFEQWSENVIRLLDGEKPLYIVNDVWPRTS